LKSVVGNAVMRLDVKDLYKHPDGCLYAAVAQFQKDGKIAYLFGADDESEKYMSKWCDFKRDKTPAQLRQN